MTYDPYALIRGRKLAGSPTPPPPQRLYLYLLQRQPPMWPTTRVAVAILVAAVAATAAAERAGAVSYTVAVVSKAAEPVVSWQKPAANSRFYQPFNPSWIAASEGTGGTCGLIVRSQNCSAKPGTCVKCNGPGQQRSLISFAKQLTPACDGPTSSTLAPTFARTDQSTVVFQPSSDIDAHGTEDPRVALLPNGTYVMLYTAYGIQGSNNGSVLLSMATATDPTDASSWVRHGAVFPGKQGSKSGALVHRPDGPPHFLYWGDSTITVASCDNDDLRGFADIKPLIQPRPDHFDSKLVESGPPPFVLSDGNLFFLHNSANESLAYHPGWVVTNGTDPTQVLQRSEEPLLTPDEAWTIGAAPALCNVPSVVFLEAAHPTGNKDEFRVFFGGADTVIGTAVVSVGIDAGFN